MPLRPPGIGARRDTMGEQGGVVCSGEGETGGFGGLVRLSDREFRLVSELVYAQTGITLGEQKRSLVIGRLNRELRRNGFRTFEEYYNHVISDASGAALNTLIERISTNHTYFWRESGHFEFFRDTVLPGIVDALRKKGRRDIRIWCAGCSSGEEPYTLAMLLQECLGPEIGTWDAGILATDISDRVIAAAREGVYRDENVAALPPKLRYAHLIRAGGNEWTVDEGTRRLVLFRKLNLMRRDYPFRGRFHTIFCRNVMIYFDTPTRQALVERFHRYMEDGGYLFIGHSESLGRSGCPFHYQCPAVYRKGPGA